MLTLEAFAVVLAVGAIATGLRMAWRDWQVDQAARERLDRADADRASDDEFTRSIRDWGHIRDRDNLR
jgi:hypothetical protein